MKSKWFYILIISLSCLLGISCEKLINAGEEEEEDKEQVEKKERAEFNNSKMEGIGNVYLSDATPTPGSLQLYAKAEYYKGHIAYYLSPAAADDLGTDHRVVFSGDIADQTIVEMDEKDLLLRIYTEKEGKRQPILLQIREFGLNEYQYQLYRIDWTNQVEELVSSAYFRDGKVIGTFHTKEKTARSIKSQGNSATSDSLGFAGHQRPKKQATVGETMSVVLTYFPQVMKSMLDHQDGGMDAILFSLTEENAVTSAFRTLKRDLEEMTQSLSEAGAAFKSFRTDPLASNDALKTFSWYSGNTTTAVDPKDVILTALLPASQLSFNDLEKDSRVKLILQVEDKNKKALTGQPIFVDFRIELEQDGKVHLLSEQTLSSDKVKGQVEFIYNAHQEIVKPKAGSKFTVLYRPSANSTAPYLRQTINIQDNEPSKISIVSGNAQVADWDEKLKLPLVVKVTNKSGQALKNVPIRWNVESSSWGVIVGKLSETQYTTDTNGMASTNYQVGRQQQKPETVTAEVLRADGSPISGAKVTFAYKQLIKNYVLIHLKNNTDNPSDLSLYKEWKNGDAITIMENESIPFDLKLNGEIQNPTTVNSSVYLMSTMGIVLGTKYENKTFQSKDITLKNFAIKFSDRLNGRTDSIVVDLTISNQLYRTFVGKTIRVEGGGSKLDGNDDEVLTFTYRADGKVEIKSLKYPTSNVLTTFTTLNFPRFVPVFGCSVNGIMPHSMKQIIGVITSPSRPSMAYGMSASFILFADGTIKPNNLGIGFDACTFNRYWKSIHVE